MTSRLCVVFKDKINYSGSEKSLRCILKDSGFMFRKAVNNWKILIEKHKIS